MRSGWSWGHTLMRFEAWGRRSRWWLTFLIEHYGDDLFRGWVMAARHVSMAAAFGALISVDEYNYTESH